MKSLRVISAFLLLAAWSAVSASAQDEPNRFSIGIGAGLVDATGVTEPYFTGNFRIRFGQGEEERRGGVAGFLEPEIGYWEGDRQVAGTTFSQEDLLLGVNLGGIVMLRSVEYFVGAGIGIHFLDQGVDIAGVDLDSEESLGVNANFGVDVFVNEGFSVFGVGRFDLIDELEDEEQAKVYLGGRFHF